MMMRGKALSGWVRAGADAYGDDGLRQKLIEAALIFVESLRSDRSSNLIGTLAGEIEIGPEFDEPLPEDFTAAFKDETR